VNCLINTNDNSYLIDSTIKVTYSIVKGERKADTTFIPLNIKVINCDSLMNIPNVFSPNNDDFNDFFIVDTNGKSIYYFSVFSSSGTLIYKSESPSIIWDGRSMSGQEMGNGIYYYTISRKDNVFLNEVKGFVYLFLFTEEPKD